MAVDKIKLNDDGTIRLPWQGTEVTLRRPGLGTFKALRLAAAEMTTQVTETMEAGDDAEGVAEGLIIDWWRLCFARLGPDDFVLSEDLDLWPVWAVYGQGVVASMIGHWRAVPLDHGGNLATV